MDGSYTAKSIYTYDDDGNVLTRIGQSFMSGAWVNSTRTDYQYDSDGREILREDYKWIDGAFVRHHLYITEYNEDGYETLKESYDTKEYLISILGDDYYIFEEDNYITLRNITYRNEFNNPDSLLSILNNYNSPAEPGTVLENIPEHHSMNRYYYDLYEDPTGIAEFERNTFVIYPNPINNIFFIDNPNLEPVNLTIYNILGKKVWSREGFKNNAREQISLGQLTPGHYLLLIQNASGRQFTYPVVKQ